MEYTSILNLDHTEIDILNILSTFRPSVPSQ